MTILTCVTGYRSRGWLVWLVLPHWLDLYLLEYARLLTLGGKRLRSGSDSIHAVPPRLEPVRSPDRAPENFVSLFLRYVSAAYQSGSMIPLPPVAPLYSFTIRCFPPTHAWRLPPLPIMLVNWELSFLPVCVTDHEIIGRFFTTRRAPAWRLLIWSSSSRLTSRDFPPHFF